MRRFIHLALIASFIGGVTPVFSQDKKEPLKGLSGLIGVQSGDYKFFQYDKGELQKTYLDKLFADREEDKKYFQDAVLKIEAEFKTFMGSALYDIGEASLANDKITLNVKKQGGLVWLSQQSTANSAFVKAIDLLNVSNAYNKARMQMELRIASLTAIQEGGLPSQTKLNAEGSGLENIPKVGNMDFSPIRKFYDEKLKEIVVVVEELEFNVITPDGTKSITKGLAIPDGAVKLSKDAIEAMMEEKDNLRNWEAKDEDIINNYTKYQRQFASDFISTYGHRWYKLNENEKVAREKDAKLIADGFWTRSYLRASYGMPIGAIAIDYTPRIANLDWLTTSTNALKNFREQPAWVEKDFIRIDQNFRNCLERAGIRAEKIMDGNLGFLATGENLLTYIGGKRNQAQASLMMLAIMGADLYEERLVQQAGGLAKMEARFRERYLRTPEDVKYYEQLAADYDPSGRDSATGINDQSLLGQFRKVRTRMKLKAIDLKKADKLIDTIELATGGNRWEDERKERNKRLFGGGGK